MIPTLQLNSFEGKFRPSFSSAEALHNAISTFLIRHLPQWANDSKYHDQKLPEDELSDALCLYLDVSARDSLSQVSFINQQRQGNRHSADMGIRPGSINGINIGSRYCHRDEPLAVIEAKRLPTPGTGRHREYVIGDSGSKSGGIERFKEQLHGKGMPKAYMFGYIQEKLNEGSWINQVNNWISEVSSNVVPGMHAPWSDADHLQENNHLTNDRLQVLTSEHVRIDQSSIALWHGWIDLCKS